MIALALSAALLGAPAETTCGTKELYGRTYTLYAHNVTCAEVEQITSGTCDVFAEPWYCASGHAPGPPLHWGKSAEIFADEPTAWIDTRRAPCAESKVSAAGWKRARKPADAQFPTERQLLTDDVLRCRQVRRGMTGRAVTRLLGRPDERSGRELSWELGPERGSVMQIDSEYLHVALDRKGRVRLAGIYQG